MQVPGAADQIRVDVVGGEVANGAGVGQDRPVIGPGEDDGYARGRARTDPAIGHVHSPLREGGQHELAERIGAHRGDQRRAQPEPRGAARDDGGGTADHEVGVVDQSLHLPESGRHVLPGKDEVGVAVPDDEQVEGGHDRSLADPLCPFPRASQPAGTLT